MTSKQCGEFISLLRKEKNLTQKQLAQKINVTDKAVSRWETGRGYPDVTSLTALSEFFGISVNELLAGKRVSDECAKEVADENVISVIKESKRVKLKSLITVIVTYISMCIVCFALGLGLMPPGSSPVTAVASAVIVCICLCIAGILLAAYQPKKVLIAYCATIISAWLVVPSFYFVSLCLLEETVPSIITEIISLVVLFLGIPGFLFLNIMSENLNSNPVFIYIVVFVLCSVVPVAVSYLYSKSKRNLQAIP
ncbi:MAG: helix-turn-helix transcriptional regulator [Clostridia bacterium]|nr:helix-turn-helix transcriptional regulator [Clostridia bacterium]